MLCLDVWGNGFRNPLEREPRTSTASFSGTYKERMGTVAWLCLFPTHFRRASALGQIQPFENPEGEQQDLHPCQASKEHPCRLPRTSPADWHHNQVLLAGLSLQQDCTLWVVVTAIRSLLQHGSTVIASCEPKDGFSLTNFRLLFVHCAKVCIGPIYSEKWGWQDNRGTTIRAN